MCNVIIIATILPTNTLHVLLQFSWKISYFIIYTFTNQFISYSCLLKQISANHISACTIP